MIAAMGSDTDPADLVDLREEIELLRDVHQGLADAEAGRVTSHEEARIRLTARYAS
jgi:predicted transcriptional regulator